MAKICFFKKLNLKIIFLPEDAIMIASAIPELLERVETGFMPRRAVHIGIEAPERGQKNPAPLSGGLSHV